MVFCMSGFDMSSLTPLTVILLMTWHALITAVLSLVLKIEHRGKADYQVNSGGKGEKYLEAGAADAYSRSPFRERTQ
jgi:hypothetical protein